MVNAMAGISGVIDRGSPAAATEAMITRVVFEELNRARPSNSTRRLSRDASLASCGIDAARFLDAIHCLDAKSGSENWIAFADAPVRFPPTIAHGKAYFGSDDGFAYCVDIKSGDTLWKARAAPSPRLIP